MGLRIGLAEGQRVLTQRGKGAKTWKEREGGDALLFLATKRPDGGCRRRGAKVALVGAWMGRKGRTVFSFRFVANGDWAGG